MGMIASLDKFDRFSQRFRFIPSRSEDTLVHLAKSGFPKFGKLQEHQDSIVYDIDLDFTSKFWKMALGAVRYEAKDVK